ncbi:unnamed protein product [Peronospora destructor]|uniref:Retroviral polymerase SH3-like domain-containing protein n=1 Tax=Peronospora destructor TaxID=86335 RepID=A0AAV0VF10_9STRA|nr:unnamed protein product [Peronospora destructor]
MVWCMLFGSSVPVCSFHFKPQPTRANAKRASLVEILTGKAPSLQDIVVFGSPCQVWRDPVKKSLKAHTVAGFILGKSKKAKGYKVLLRGDRSVITTRHVTEIETLDESTNKLVADALKREDDAELELIATSRARAVQKKQDAARAEEKQKNTVTRTSNKKEKTSKHQVDQCGTRNALRRSLKGKLRQTATKFQVQNRSISRLVLQRRSPPIHQQADRRHY